MLQPRPYLEVFWPCAMRVRTAASGDGSAQWWILLRNDPECGAEILYRFLAHYCCRCITVSSSPAAELNCCETGRARLLPASTECEIIHCVSQSWSFVGTDCDVTLGKDLGGE